MCYVKYGHRNYFVNYLSRLLGDYEFSDFKSTFDTLKKIISTITVVIYFAVSCGIMVNFHYCMDRYASFQLYGSSDEKCDLCGMHTDENGCCRDEIKILKLEDDQRTAEVVFSFYEVASPEIIPSKFIDTDFYTVPVPDLFNNHSPPLITQQDTYLQNCVFRI